MHQTLQIEELVDGQRFGLFNINLLLCSFLAMIADGYDIAALASAAPQLARSWHLTAKAFAPALSASLFGILIGAPLLGYVGDRFGRKSAIVAGCAIYGLGTLATVWATSLDQVMVLRFLAGLGIGGLMPNTIALNSELAPKRLRAALVVLMFTGITTGGAIPGYVQAWLIPRYGWPIMFWIGGIAPLIIAAGLLFALPESVKYLARRPERRAELLATLRRLRRDLVIGDDAQLIIASAPRVPGTGLAKLLSGRLAWVTPILWLCFITALMANYFLNSWLPLIFESNGFTAQQSGMAISVYHYGGTLGGLCVALVLGRFGFSAIAVLFLLAVPAIASIGMPGISFATMASMVALAGFCTLGAQFGNNAASGLLYPTAYRSRGVGWALGLGRLGSVVGPLVGGVLLGSKLPLQQLFVFAAIPMAAGLIAAAALARLCYRALGSLQLDDMGPGNVGQQEKVAASVADVPKALADK
jgi:MFS transporter, AAHS family, 4-hydroxybenzoate transporter